MSRQRQKRLYTPQLHEKNVRKLHHAAKRLGMPMTKLLNLIVCTGLEELQHAPDLCDEPRRKEMAHG